MPAIAPSNVYSILSNADFPYPTVALSGGRKVKLDQETYSNLRALPNREDRELVMSTYLQSLGSFSATLGGR